jgi:hypothetical protein
MRTLQIGIENFEVFKENVWDESFAVEIGPWRDCSIW